MNRIIILGSPGAGKSTFARKLRDKTGIPLYYLDMLWHKPDKSTVREEEFDSALYEIIKQERWIIDGNYLRTIPMRLRHCDTVFLLDYPTDICIAGVRSRIGIVREDMPWVETEFDEEFKQWILDFPQDQLPRIYTWLEKCTDKEIYVFKSPQDAAEYLCKI